jgi:hypothetical protein
LELYFLRRDQSLPLHGGNGLQASYKQATDARQQTWRNGIPENFLYCSNQQ